LTYYQLLAHTKSTKPTFEDPAKSQFNKTKTQFNKAGKNFSVYLTKKTPSPWLQGSEAARALLPPQEHPSVIWQIL